MNFARVGSMSVGSYITCFRFNPLYWIGKLPAGTITGARSSSVHKNAFMNWVTLYLYARSAAVLWKVTLGGESHFCNLYSRYCSFVNFVSCFSINNYSWSFRLYQLGQKHAKYMINLRIFTIWGNIPTGLDNHESILYYWLTKFMYVYVHVYII